MAVVTSVCGAAVYFITGLRLRSPGRILFDAVPLCLLPGSVEAVFVLRLPLRVPVLRLVLDSADLVPPVPNMLLLYRRLFFFSVLHMHSFPSAHPR
jgi:hypothetical protein